MQQTRLAYSGQGFAGDLRHQPTTIDLFLSPRISTLFLFWFPDQTLITWKMSFCFGFQLKLYLHGKCAQGRSRCRSHAWFQAEGGFPWSRRRKRVAGFWPSRHRPAESPVVGPCACHWSSREGRAGTEEEESDGAAGWRRRPVVSGENGRRRRGTVLVTEWSFIPFWWWLRLANGWVISWLPTWSLSLAGLILRLYSVIWTEFRTSWDWRGLQEIHTNQIGNWSHIILRWIYRWVA